MSLSASPSHLQLVFSLNSTNCWPYIALARAQTTFACTEPRTTLPISPTTFFYKNIFMCQAECCGVQPEWRHFNICWEISFFTFFVSRDLMSRKKWKSGVGTTSDVKSLAA